MASLLLTLYLPIPQFVQFTIVCILIVLPNFFPCSSSGNHGITSQLLYCPFFFLGLSLETETHRKEAPSSGCPVSAGMNRHPCTSSQRPASGALRLFLLSKENEAGASVRVQEQTGQLEGGCRERKVYNEQSTLLTPETNPLGIKS